MSAIPNTILIAIADITEAYLEDARMSYEEEPSKKHPYHALTLLSQFADSYCDDDSITQKTLGELLSSSNETVRRNATSILKQLQRARI